MCLACKSVWAVGVEVDMFADVVVAAVGYGGGIVAVGVSVEVESDNSVVGVAVLCIPCDGVDVGVISASFHLNIFGVAVFVRIVDCWC